MWTQLIRSFADATQCRQLAYHDPPIRRPGATSPLRPRSDRKRFPPRLPACSARHDCTGSAALSPGGQRETDMLEAVLALLGLVVGAALAAVVMRSRGGSGGGRRGQRGRAPAG